MGKGDRKKRLKHKKPLQAPIGRGIETRATDMPEPRGKAVRPTPERLRQGSVSVPYGVGKHERPALVLDGDMVAHLYEAGVISYTQEQAARCFQQLHADYVAELGISTGRSCLDIGPVGHDEGEGNPDIAARHRKIVRALGIQRDAEIRHVTIGGKKPRNIPMLRDALNVVSGGC